MKKFLKSVGKFIEDVNDYFEKHKCKVVMALLGWVIAPVFKSRKTTCIVGVWFACVCGIIGNRIDEIHQVAEKVKNRYWL